MPSTQAISYGRYRTRFRRERDQFPGIGFRIPEVVTTTFNAKDAKDAKLPIVRPGPQSGPRNGASRENANQKRQRFVFSRLVPFRSAADYVGRRSRDSSSSRCLCVSGADPRGSDRSVTISLRSLRPLRFNVRQFVSAIWRSVRRTPIPAPLPASGLARCWRARRIRAARSPPRSAPSSASF